MRFARDSGEARGKGEGAQDEDHHLVRQGGEDDRQGGVGGDKVERGVGLVDGFDRGLVLCRLGLLMDDRCRVVGSQRGDWSFPGVLGKRTQELLAELDRRRFRTVLALLVVGIKLDRTLELEPSREGRRRGGALDGGGAANRDDRICRRRDRGGTRRGS